MIVTVTEGGGSLLVQVAVLLAKGMNCRGVDSERVADVFDHAPGYQLPHNATTDVWDVVLGEERMRTPTDVVSVGQEEYPAVHPVGLLRTVGIYREPERRDGEERVVSFEPRLLQVDVSL